MLVGEALKMILESLIDDPPWFREDVIYPSGGGPQGTRLGGAAKMVSRRTRAKGRGVEVQHASGLRNAGRPLSLLLLCRCQDSLRFPPLGIGSGRDIHLTWYSHDGIARDWTRSTSSGYRTMGSCLPLCVAELGSPYS
jgi:hypothetical protein